MKIDRFIVSTNENDNYIYCWPLVAQVTKKLFNCEISLAFITDRKENDNLVNYFRTFGDVVLYPLIDNIPSGNQAKVSRMFLSSVCENETCCINDVDILPLQSEFILNNIKDISDDKMIQVGANAYFNTKDHGKCPMIYTVAKSSVFRECINPLKLSYEDLLKSWMGIKKFDSMESIENSPENFSDESLLRVLINRWVNKKNVCHIHRNFKNHKAIERIDRIDWKINRNKLMSGWYIDAHLPRPLSKKYFMVKEIANYFGVKDYIDVIDKIR